MFNRSTVLSCTICSFVVMLGADWQAGARGETLLFDNFDDGNYSDDSPGTWIPVFNPVLEASSGDLSIIKNGCCGGATWNHTIDGDVSVQTRARIVGGNLGITTKFGGGTGNDGYYFEVQSDNNLFFLARVNGVEYPIEPGITVTPGDNEDIFLQLDVVGNQVSGWYWTESGGPPLAPQIQAELTHPLIEGGDAGFYVTDESVLRYARIADTPIPEPTSLALGLSVLMISGLRRTSFVDRTN